MQPLTSAQLLAVWENAFNFSPIEKACFILSVASDSIDMEIVKKWSIEERDIKLFHLRRWMFGDHFINTANCSKCNEKVEWETSINDFSIPALPLGQAYDTFQFSKQGYEISFRLPNSEDLIETCSEEILRNCLLEIKKNDKLISLQNLPTTILEKLDEEMENVSPLTNISFELICPACANKWEMNFDILTYLWTEIDEWSKRLLEEVYLLANAFKWSEKDILNMSERRRKIYLNMLQS